MAPIKTSVTARLKPPDCSLRSVSTCIRLASGGAGLYWFRGMGKWLYWESPPTSVAG